MTGAVVALLLAGSVGIESVRQDHAETAPVVRDPAWGVHGGDVLAYTTGSGVEVRLEVIAVLPPDDSFDYLRVHARVVEPVGVDLRDPLGQDSIMPVGDAGESMSLSEAAELAVAPPPAAPGLVVVAPEGAGADAEPALAGFRILHGAERSGGIDGYAVLHDWASLARRLDAAASHAG